MPISYSIPKVQLVETVHLKTKLLVFQKLQNNGMGCVTFEACNV